MQQEPPAKVNSNRPGTTIALKFWVRPKPLDPRAVGLLEPVLIHALAIVLLYYQKTKGGGSKARRTRSIPVVFDLPPPLQTPVPGVDTSAGDFKRLTFSLDCYSLATNNEILAARQKPD